MRRVPLLVLALMALINIGRGCIHAFAPDGGAHSIAGLDLTRDSQTILSLFATLGLGQIALGLTEAYVVLRRRDAVGLLLALQTLQTLGAMANLYLWRPLPVVVPGQPFNLGLLALQLAALAIAWRWPATAKP
jgi:hypothetical protein